MNKLKQYIALFEMISLHEIHIQLGSCMGWTTIIFGSVIAVCVVFSLFLYCLMSLLLVGQMESSWRKIPELDSFARLHLLWWRKYLSSLVVFSNMESLLSSTSTTANELIDMESVGWIFCSLSDKFLPSSAVFSLLRWFPHAVFSLSGFAATLGLLKAGQLLINLQEICLQ